MGIAGGSCLFIIYTEKLSALNGVQLLMHLTGGGLKSLGNFIRGLL